MINLLLVALGGGLGAAGRHLVNLAALRSFGPGFPAGTLAVNVLGSLLMGLLVGWLAARAGGSGNALRLFLATGFLGGFTTFSAFSLDVALLWERGALGVAALYAGVSVTASILALFAGLAAMRVIAAG
ncbi:fluoride efflux transporter CrcB [Stappia sp. MMSF_3263]|uniref:fluoride efflux transporter CrcB n=1 Tax=Stappia sp. MMSF_3263 TaxID=3046693 RepID=UPI00273FB0CA|nr:fluoride efflux transporter CrcB [Stappia sp. MMSF_3263]